MRFSQTLKMFASQSLRTHFRVQGFWTPRPESLSVFFVPGAVAVRASDAPSKCSLVQPIVSTFFTSYFDHCLSRHIGQSDLTRLTDIILVSLPRVQSIKLHLSVRFLHWNSSELIWLWRQGRP